MVFWIFKNNVLYVLFLNKNMHTLPEFFMRSSLTRCLYWYVFYVAKGDTFSINWKTENNLTFQSLLDTRKEIMNTVTVVGSKQDVDAVDSVNSTEIHFPPNNLVLGGLSNCICPHTR